MSLAQCCAIGHILIVTALLMGAGARYHAGNVTLSLAS